MKQEKIIVGLDIGSTKVLALVGKQNSLGYLEVLGVGQAVSEGVTRGVITNLDKTVIAIKEAIKQAEESSGIDIRIVNIGIAGRHITSSMYHGSITRENTEEEITVEDVNRLAKDMYKILTPPGSQIIHVIPQSYTVDYEADIKDPVGMAGIRLEADFHIITAATSAINNIYKCTQKAGLEIAELILEPLSASLAVLSSEEKEAGVCLIDIGGAIVDIAIFHEGILRHTAIIPLGAHSMTTDIKIGLQVMEYQAELLKKQFGKAIVEETTPEEVISIPGLRNRPPKEVSLRNLAQIIEARMEEIIELVHTEIIISGFNNKLAAGIVITGGGAQLPSLKKLVEYVTGLDTRLGYPNDLVAKEDFEEIKNPTYATGIGLILAGFQESLANKKSSTKNNSKQALKKEKQEKHFLKKILNRTKGLLIDDYEGHEQ